MRQQFVDPVVRMPVQPLEHVLEVQPRIVAIATLLGPCLQEQAANLGIGGKRERRRTIISAAIRIGSLL